MKLNLYVNNARYLNGKFVYHYAIFQQKNSCLDTTAEIKEAFFRDPSSETEKSKDFVDRTTDDFWDITYIDGKLNPDKFHIITHGRLFTDTETNWNKEQDSMQFQIKNKYIPIKRKLNYPDNTTLKPTDPIKFAIWWMPIDKSQYVVGVPQFSQFRVNITSYYYNII